MRKFLKISFLTLLLVLAAGWAGLWLGQDRLIRLFVTALNEHLAVPVRASRLEVSVLDQFPRLSVTLHDVVMHGSLPQDTVRLARARRLYCAFDAWDLLAGRYRVREIRLADGHIHVRRNARGEANYHILQPDTAQQPANEPFGLELEGIRLERMRIAYQDAGRQQSFALHTPDLRATVGIRAARVAVAVTGPARVEVLQLGADAYFRDRPLHLRTTLIIDRAAQELTVEPSEIKVGAAAYAVAGTINYRHATQLDLRGTATGADAQSVLALLPRRFTQPLAGYRSRGAVYFAGTVRGEWSEQQQPAVAVTFGCRAASFFHPQYRQAIDHVYLSGRFSNGPARSARTCVLALTGIRGQLAGRPFSGALQVTNFAAPQLDVTLRANLDVARAVRFFPLAAVQSAQGEAQLQLHLHGPLRELRRRPTARQARGELVLRNVTLRLRDFRQPFNDLQARLLLSGADVAVPALSGRLGNSDFRVRGTLRNATGWALQPGQQLRLEATATSRLLDFNQLLYTYQPSAAGPAGAAVARRPEEAGLRVPATLALNVRTQVQQVRFRRLRGRQLRGTLRLQQQVFSSPGLSLLAAGGAVSVRGTVDARQPHLLKARTVASCQQMPLDSLFYVFEDFGQQFLTARHLRGRLTATAESDTYFDAHLSPLTDRLEAEVQATIHQGELLDFAPLQRLSMVASRATLRHLRFAELHNRLYVQSRTVYVPEMDIRSNVRAVALIRVTGTHTFDQQLDYHVQIPLLPGLLPRVLTRADGPVLRLGIRGSESDFAVRYETGPPTQPAGNPPARRPAPTAAGPASRAAPAPEPARPSFEVKKPAKKPAQPQVGEYFEF